MHVHVIGFSSDMVVGLDGEFNTVRIGLFFQKKLKVGERVFLMDEGERVVFGEASVISVEVAALGEICLVHADQNHTEKHQKDGQSSARLFKTLQKIYGPHIATPEKRATVIYLRRLPPVED